MSTNTADRMPHDAVLAGATGLVGQALAAQWPGPGTLHLLVRRAVPAAAALQQVHVVDFAALTALPRAAGGARSAYCALGTTIKVAGSQAAFRAVDFDAVLAFAHAAKSAGVRHFAVVSALGASATSSNFYSRVKGETETALVELGFDALIIARPSLLTGDRRALGQPMRSGERWTQALARPLAPLLPQAWRPIAGATVARALLRAVAEAEQKGPSAPRWLDSAQLQQLGH